MYWRHWAPAVATLHDMMERGVAIDVGAIADARMLAVADEKHFAAAFAGWAPDVNPNSSQQLAELFYAKKKYRVPHSCGSRKNPRKTPKDHRPADQVAIDRLLIAAPAHDREGLQALIDLRETSKLNKYLQALPDHAREGRIHAAFAPDTDTGRLACRAPALQQIPKDARYGLRRMFVAAPGHSLVAADMSQLELRVAAHLLIKKFNDRRLAEDLQARDIHSVAAMRAWPDRLTGIDVGAIKNHPDPAIARLREWAKAVIYGLFYGKSEVGLAVQLGIEKGVAAEVKASIMAAYGVDRYQEWVQDFAARTGYVTTLLGRRRQLVAATGPIGPSYFGAMRQAMNTPIQGSAADLMMIAMARVDRALPGTLVLQIHDELVLEVPEADVDSARKQLKMCMESVSEFLSVPLIANVGSGCNWEECK
jgi:DNA polymerase-1